MPFSDEKPSTLDARHTMPRPPKIVSKKSEPAMKLSQEIKQDFNPSASLRKTPRINSSGSGTGSNGEVTPLSRPGKELDKALAYMSDPGCEWNKHVEALSIVRSLTNFNQDILLPKIAETTQLVIKNVANLRSKVSGVAIEAMRDLFRVLRKGVAPQLDAAIKVLLTEAGKENAFLREKVNDSFFYQLSYTCQIERCLDEGVQAMVVDNLGGKVLASLVQHQKSKNQTCKSSNVGKYLTIFSAYTCCQIRLRNNQPNGSWESAF
jgi:hypothetical protein